MRASQRRIPLNRRLEHDHLLNAAWEAVLRRCCFCLSSIEPSVPLIAEAESKPRERVPEHRMCEVSFFNAGMEQGVCVLA